MDTSRDFAILAALVSRRLRAKLKEYLPNDTLTAVEWFALLWMDQGGGSITQTQLAEKLELSDAPASRLARSLVEHGLVARESSKFDRRVNALSLTPAAKPYLDLAREIGSRLRSRVFAGIAQEDVQTSLKVLRLVAARLE